MIGADLDANRPVGIVLNFLVNRTDPRRWHYPDRCRRLQVTGGRCPELLDRDVFWFREIFGLTAIESVPGFDKIAVRSTV
jgi:hypothetical protein